jgi:hypothetical protein
MNRKTFIHGLSKKIIQSLESSLKTHYSIIYAILIATATWLYHQGQHILWRLLNLYTKYSDICYVVK